MHATAAAAAVAPAATPGSGKKIAKAQANGTQQTPQLATAAFDWAFAGQYILATRTGLEAAKAALEVKQSPQSLLNPSTPEAVSPARRL